MNKTTNIACAVILAAIAASCGTSLTTSDGSTFRTYSNGKKLAMRLPNGASLQMEDYDHAASILAAGQAVNTATQPVADIVKTSLWTKLWGLVSHDATNVANTRSNNDTSLAKTVDNNKTSAILQQNHNTSALSAQAGGAEVAPVAIK